VPPWSPCPVAGCVALALFCSTRRAAHSQWGMAWNHFAVAVFGLALPFAMDGGVVLGGSLAELGGSWERAELLLARQVFPREHPKGGKHHFCLLCWLQNHRNIEWFGSEGTL